MNSDVIIEKREIYTYPSIGTYRPSKRYPEYIFKDYISNEDNEIYDMVRECFHMAGYDIDNYNKTDWNPLKTIVSPGDIVLIKPNLVMDKNIYGVDCLYTHPSVVSAIVDFVLIALKDSGKIIIGDAPMQECDFDNLIQSSGYEKMIKFYKEIVPNIEISLVDFRELKSIREHGMYKQTIIKNKSKVIDLKDESEFFSLNQEQMDKLRITNYDPRILNNQHSVNKHRYCISEYVLEADVIINVPKPKTHRKAGITCALKNIVGTNSRKEYLPHHIVGSKKVGGDEYYNKSKVKQMRSYLLDKRNYISYNSGNVFFVFLIRVFIKICNLYIKFFINDQFEEGSWYGNDTICRTIVDVNKILLYSDKNGKMKDSIQKQYLVIADMIVSGEGDGPLNPSPKNVGIIALAQNPVLFDEVMSKLMGIFPSKFPTLMYAKNVKGKYKLLEKKHVAKIISNYPQWHNKSLDDIEDESLLFFKPTLGWKEVFHEPK